MAGIQPLNMQTGDSAHCVAALCYVYEHGVRELSKRLMKIFHEHYDLSVASLHVHLDRGNGMELSLLRGKVGEVQQLTDGIIAERGVRNGKLVIVPAADAAHDDRSS